MKPLKTKYKPVPHKDILCDRCDTVACCREAGRDGNRQPCWRHYKELNRKENG